MTNISKRRLFFKTLLSNTILVIFLVTMAIMLHFIMSGQVSYFLWVLAAPFYGFMLTRFFTKQFSVFVLFHIAIVVVTVLVMGMGTYAVPTRVFLVFSLPLSFLLRSTNEWLPGRATFGLLFICYLVLLVVLRLLFTEYRDFLELELQLVYMFLFSCGILLTYIQMDEFDYRLEILRRIDDYKRSADNVISMNNLLITVFSFIVVVFAIIGILLRPTQLILNGINAFWGFFARLFTRDAQEFMENIQEMPWYGFEEYEFPPAIGYNPIQEAMEEYMVSEELAYNITIRLNTMLFIIAMIFVVLVLIRVIYRAYLRIRSQKDSNTPADEDIIVTKLSHSFFADIINMLPTFKGANIHPLRKKYAKKVNSHIRAGVIIHNSDTVEVIAEKIRKTENIDSLTTQYEQVRYGRMG